MTTLLRPDNLQPAAYVTARNGHVCLRTTCITPSVMWFSDAAMNKLNPVQGCAEPPRAIVLYVAPKPLVVTMPADLLVHIREAVYCELRVA